jgi:hypothetical protein
MQHSFPSERRVYLGSRPDDARKDSHTYSINQTTCAAMTAVCGEHTDRTNFKAGIVPMLVVLPWKSDAELRSAVGDGDEGWSGMASCLGPSVGRAESLGRHVAGWFLSPATRATHETRREPPQDHDTPIVGTTPAHINHDVGLVIPGARFPRAVACADSQATLYTAVHSAGGFPMHATASGYVLSAPCHFHDSQVLMRAQPNPSSWPCFTCPRRFPPPI